MIIYLIGCFFLVIFLCSIYPLSIPRQCVAIISAILWVAFMVKVELNV